MVPSPVQQPVVAVPVPTVEGKRCVSLSPNHYIAKTINTRRRSASPRRRVCKSKEECIPVARSLSPYRVKLSTSPEVPQCRALQPVRAILAAATTQQSGVPGQQTEWAQRVPVALGQPKSPAGSIVQNAVVGGAPAPVGTAPAVNNSLAARSPSPEEMKNAFRENAIHFFKFVKDMQEQCIKAGVEPLRLRRYYSRGDDNMLHKTHMTVEQMLAEDDGQGSFHDIWEDVEDDLSDCNGDVEAQQKHQQQQKQLSTITSHEARRPDISFSNLHPALLASPELLMTSHRRNSGMNLGIRGHRGGIFRNSTVADLPMSSVLEMANTNTSAPKTLAQISVTTTNSVQAVQHQTLQRELSPPAIAWSRTANQRGHCTRRDLSPVAIARPVHRVIGTLLHQGGASSPSSRTGGLSRCVAEEACRSVTCPDEHPMKKVFSPRGGSAVKAESPQSSGSIREENPFVQAYPARWSPKSPKTPGSNPLRWNSLPQGLESKARGRPVERSPVRGHKTFPSDRGPTGKEFSSEAVKHQPAMTAQCLTKCESAQKECSAAYPLADSWRQQHQGNECKPCNQHLISEESLTSIQSGFGIPAKLPDSISPSKSSSASPGQLPNQKMSSGGLIPTASDIPLMAESLNFIPATTEPRRPTDKTKLHSDIPVVDQRKNSSDHESPRQTQCHATTIGAPHEKTSDAPVPSKVPLMTSPWPTPTGRTGAARPAVSPPAASRVVQTFFEDRNPVGLGLRSCMDISPRLSSGLSKGVSIRESTADSFLANIRGGRLRPPRVPRSNDQGAKTTSAGPNSDNPPSPRRSFTWTINKFVKGAESSVSTVPIVMNGAALKFAVNGAAALLLERQGDVRTSTQAKPELTPASNPTPTTAATASHSSTESWISGAASALGVPSAGSIRAMNGGAAVVVGGIDAKLTALHTSSRGDPTLPSSCQLKSTPIVRKRSTQGA